MSSRTASTISELCGVREVAANLYESISIPERMGNTANIAYGGCTLAVTLSAAHASLPSSVYYCYSATGSYLAPALTDRRYRISISKVRDTNTFATRQVETAQILDDGTTRICMLALVDFQRREPQTFLKYSVKPSLPLVNVDNLGSFAEQTKKLTEKGVVSKKQATARDVMFAIVDRHFDWRPHPDGINGQNVFGLAKAAPTSQDDRALTSKLSSDYIRTKQALETPKENISALAFLIDFAMHVVALVHDHKFLEDSKACSSLEFALRVFSNDIDMNRWKLREIGTIVGGEGRTYSEARLWDENRDLIASMTQQAILRPLPAKKTKGRL
jgi:acyl-CoA thioesterase II